MVDSLRTTGKLPGNFVTKDEARKLGWEEGKSVTAFLGDKRIGGDTFNDTFGELPKADGRTWKEADIGLKSTGKRSSERILYSNDGKVYITTDHYKTYHPYPDAD